MTGFTETSGPRVRLTYSVGDADGDARELAFIVGVVADLAPASAKPPVPLARRRFITVTERSFDAVVAGLAPLLALSVPDRLRGHGTLAVDLAFTRLTDFDPEAVASQVPDLRALVDLRGGLAGAKRRLWTGSPKSAVRSAGSVLEELEGLTDPMTLLVPADGDGDVLQRVDVQAPIRALAALAASVPVMSREAATAILDRRITETDALLGRQLDAILHMPAFQRLEAAWRGLHFLVRRIPTGPQLTVKVLPMSLDELRDDLAGACVRVDGRIELERQLSTVYDILYTREYGQHGGEPLGVLVVDHAFTGADEDIDLLHLLSVIASDGHMPVLASASPRLVGLQDFTELGERPIDLAANLASGSGTSRHWRAFRHRDTARYVGLVLPRVLLRLPHRADTARSRSFVYDETALDRDEHVWMGAAYPLAVRVAAAFARFGWCVAFTGLAGGGGVVADLPLPDYGLGDEDACPVPPLEVQLTEEQEQALVDAGLIALMPAQGQAFSVFYSVRSAHEPRTGLSEGAALSARLSSRLPFMFAASRMAHYLKVMTREGIGRSRSRIEIESELNRWLSQYITYQDDASIEARARRPLRDGFVTLAEIEGEPGRYLAEVTLTPHFQIEEIDFSLRLKTVLQPGAG